MSKYENGYLPKIAYHMFKGNQDRVDYFVHRQLTTYGPIEDRQRWWVIEEVHRLREQQAKPKTFEDALALCHNKDEVLAQLKNL